MTLLTEALGNMSKAGEALREKGISVNDHKEVFDYAVALAQFSAIYEISEGNDVDGDAAEEVKPILEEKKEVEKAVAACSQKN